MATLSQSYDDVLFQVAPSVRTKIVEMVSGIKAKIDLGQNAARTMDILPLLHEYLSVNSMYSDLSHQLFEIIGRDELTKDGATDVLLYVWDMISQFESTIRRHVQEICHVHIH